jgi:hypothetical protein
MRAVVVVYASPFSLATATATASHSSSIRHFAAAVIVDRLDSLLLLYNTNTKYCARRGASTYP